MRINKRGFGKKAQLMGMPFQMIFTLILIAIFLVVGFIAIRYVLDWQKQAQTALFKSELQNKITELWNKESADFTYTGTLPSQIKYVCIANINANINQNATNQTKQIWNDITIFKGQNKNLFFWPLQKDSPASNLEHLNLQDSKLPRPYCIKNEGKISIRLVKNADEALVRIVS